VLAALEVVYAEQGEHDETLVPPCTFEVLPGALPVLDHGLDCGDGCEGMAWVRLVDVSPTDWDTFPAPLARASRSEMSYSVTLEVGVARCAPVGTEDGGNYYPPTVEEQRAAADQASVDAALVRHTILDRFPADNDDAGVSLGSYGPIGPEGDVVGGATLCSVFVP
jgi:hypothetical protein